jgi:hypothetical protein
VASARGITVLAIVAGAVLGTLAALTAVQPSPRTAAPVGLPSARLASESTPIRPPPTASAATPAPESLGAEPVAPIATGRNDWDSQSAPELELACSRRRARACLALARAYDLGRGVPSDAGKGRLYRALAVSLLDEQCTARDAESCHLLGALYTSGTGVAKNETTARLLEARAKEICAGKNSELCQRLRAGTAPLP